MKKAPKVLVVRLSSFGDIVLTTPVVRGLKQQLGAEVHYLVKARYADAIAHNPHVDTLHILEDGQPLREMISQLRDAGVDFVADLHHNLRSWIVKRSLGIPAASFPKLNVEKWLMVNFKINRLPDAHIVERYCRTVERLDVVYDGQGLDFMLSEGAKDFARNQQITLGSGGYLCIAIGAGHQTKCFEPAQLIHLLGLIKFHVVLLGGPQDAEIGRDLAEQFDHVTSFAGSISLMQSAALLEKAEMVIAPDTGLMHIAAALDKSLIVYWGNTIPAFGMTPLYRQGSSARLRMFEVAGLPCRPCSKIGYDKCPKGHFRCIRQLDIVEMAATVNAWMRDAPHT